MLLLTYNPTRRALTSQIMADLMEKAYEKFPEGRDVMKLAAEYIFNCPYDHVTPAQRAAAKTEAYWFLYSTPGYGIPSRRLTVNEVSTRSTPGHPAEQAKSRKVLNFPIQAYAAAMMQEDMERSGYRDGMFFDLAKGPDKTSVGLFSAEQKRLVDVRVQEASAKMDESIKRLSEAFREGAKTFMAAASGLDLFSRHRITHREGQIISGHARALALGMINVQGTRTGRISTSRPNFPDEDMPHRSQVPKDGHAFIPMEIDWSALEARVLAMALHEDYLKVWGDPLHGHFSGGPKPLHQIPKGRLTDGLMRSRALRLVELETYGGVTQILRDEPWIDDTKKPKQKFAKALQDQRKAKTKNLRLGSTLLGGLMGKLK